MTADPQGPTQLALHLMTRFASDTGLVGEAEPRRYLWTDAFAVTNYLGLARVGALLEGLELALALVDQVHQVLGRHHPDDPRQGWISGLSAEEGETHPTRGGLRIGKPLPERAPSEPYDARLEWDRDGQYFHYLTQWMHALARVGEETGQPLFHQWALELAQSAHTAFLIRDSSPKTRRMAWKMSVDLSRPQVSTMGQHDPLAAWITYLELSWGTVERVLEREIDEVSALALGTPWETEDELGLGGLLCGISRLTRGFPRADSEPIALLDRLLRSARLSLEAYSLVDRADAPIERRLAFRELGLAQGLHTLARIDRTRLRIDHREEVEALCQYLPIARRIDDFWSQPPHRRSRGWLNHQDINAVMLAASLSPEGYLGSTA